MLMQLDYDKDLNFLPISSKGATWTSPPPPPYLEVLGTCLKVKKFH